MAQEKAKVVVIVSGGVVQGIYAGDFVEIAVVDWDNIKAGDGVTSFGPPDGNLTNLCEETRKMIDGFPEV
jgi:hypothetical protein